MLQVTVPDGVVEGGQFQANTPNGPVLDTVPPGVKSGQVLQISAPAPMVMERTELSDASTAMVGTWSNDCNCIGCFGGGSEMVITESNQVQTIHMTLHNHFCCCCGSTAEGSGSRGVNDTSMTITMTMHDSIMNGSLTFPIVNTYTITSATRDRIEMQFDSQTQKGLGSHADQRNYGTMSWDLAAKTATQRGRVGPGATWTKTA